MKVSAATINYYLKTSKLLSDGTHPIMLRVCFNGYKDVSSHYSCSVRYWDKKNQQIKKGYPNYNIINYELNKRKRQLIEKRDRYILNGISYTPSKLLSDDDVINKKSKKVKDLIDSYLSDMEFRPSTKEGWKHISSLLTDFSSSELVIDDIDLGFCKRFGKWLKVERGMVDGSIRTKLGQVGCIFRYASSLGLVDMRDYPFNDWDYSHMYGKSHKPIYIHSATIDVIKDVFLSRVISVSDNGRRFHYIDDGYVNPRNKLFSLYLWLLGYLFQGLSPIDLFYLRVSHFRVIKVDGVEYYAIDTIRQKTGMSVKVRIKRASIYSQVMVSRMLMERNDGWFLPAFRGINENDSERLHSRNKSFIHKQRVKLKEWFKELNDIIIRRNVENDTDIPLIDYDCNYYSYRHSYAQSYISNPNANPIALATLLGRSVNTLSTYIEQLSEERDLIDAVNVLSDSD